ncbi:hypothetical protein OQA88_7887 [Cercophora sp. LCS_1]
MIDPQQVVEMLGNPIKPTVTATSAPGPVPTVIPTPIEYQVASNGGHRTLWVIFAIMLASSGVFAASSWRVPVRHRVYYVTTTLMAIISTLSYFAMASGHASTFNCITVTDSHKHVPDVHHDVCRQVYWARYVDWSLTFPLLLLNLSLLAGIDGAHTLMAISASLIMTLSGLFSALGKTGTAQKWGWLAISCVSYLFVLWHIVLHGSTMVKVKGGAVTKLFSSLALFSFIVWTVYPIVWGIADGGRKINVDKEIMTYAVLDALLKPVFGLWLLISHRAIAEANIDLDGYWSQGLSAEGRIRVGDDE